MNNQNNNLKTKKYKKLINNNLKINNTLPWDNIYFKYMHRKEVLIRLHSKIYKYFNCAIEDLEYSKYNEKNNKEYSQIIKSQLFNIKNLSKSIRKLIANYLIYDEKLMSKKVYYNLGPGFKWSFYNSDKTVLKLLKKNKNIKF